MQDKIKTKTVFMYCYTWTFVLLSFLIPIYPKFTPPIIIALGLFTISGLILKYFQIGFVQFKQAHFLLALLFITYTISLLYSSDTALGMHELETKLSFIIFPFLILPLIAFPDIIKLIFRNFVYACGFALVVCTTHALWLFVIEKFRESYNLYSEGFGIDNFLSAKFSFLVHPTYLAWYFITAIIILWFTKVFSNNFLKIFVTFTLIAGVFLTGSRFGFVFLIMLFVYFGIKTIADRRMIKYILMSGLGMFIIFTVLLSLSAEMRSRFFSPVKTVFSGEIDPLAEDGTASRILVWKSALSLISANPLIGYGVGDAKKVLQDKYMVNGYLGVYKKNLNAHNQYFQTALATGIPGLFFLTMLLLFPFFKRKNGMAGLMIFSLSSCTTFMFESSLEVQAGTIFFSFFYCLFFIYAESIKNLPGVDNNPLILQYPNVTS